MCVFLYAMYPRHKPPSNSSYYHRREDGKFPVTNFKMDQRSKIVTDLYMLYRIAIKNTIEFIFLQPILDFTV